MNNSGNSEIDCQAELRDMQRAVIALRAELEKCRAVAEDAVQAARRESAQDIAQLKATIAELRNELELAGIQREQQVQQALAGNQDEILQLKKTAGELRSRLEALLFEKDAAVQAANVAAAGEIPARKVGGKYIFSSLALHEWLSQAKAAVPHREPTPEFRQRILARIERFRPLMERLADE